MASRWNTPPIAFMRVIEADLSKETKRIVGMMLQAVITQSPVDTGAFRANHRVSIGFEDFGMTATTDKSGSQTLQTGLSTAASAPLYGKVFIQNNLPYAEKLELGSSKQAPLGVYATSYNAVIQRLKT